LKLSKPNQLAWQGSGNGSFFVGGLVNARLWAIQPIFLPELVH
jgi:hypothetical protein